jgi:hypothetical protein
VGIGAVPVAALPSLEQIAAELRVPEVGQGTELSAAVGKGALQAFGADAQQLESAHLGIREL